MRIPGSSSQVSSSWPSWLGSAASTIDRAAIRAATWNNLRGARRIGRMSHEGRLSALASITGSYDDPRFFASPDLFFPPPLVARPELAWVRDLGRAQVFDARWPSGSIPFATSPEVRNGYLAHPANQTAHARLFLAKDDAPRRPVVVAIHGYLGGQYAMEERAFPVRWMVRRGFDVALVVLPFHGLRGGASRGAAPLFPGSDPRYTIEGCRQAVHDIRSLLAFLKSRGAPSVGVMGMSLGGYLTSLLATLEPLSFAIPMIPLASFADFARDQGRLGAGAEVRSQHEAFEQALRVVSPLARPSLVPPDRVLIVAAAHDQITPRAHAERLQKHFGARLVVFPGGHLLQFGRAAAFREVGRFWRGLGLGTGRTPRDRVG